jgi:hypothetical protein
VSALAAAAVVGVGMFGAPAPAQAGGTRIVVATPGVFVAIGDRDHQRYYRDYDHKDYKYRDDKYRDYDRGYRSRDYDRDRYRHKDRGYHRGFDRGYRRGYSRGYRDDCHRRY